MMDGGDMGGAGEGRSVRATSLKELLDLLDELEVAKLRGDGTEAAPEEGAPSESPAEPMAGESMGEGMSPEQLEELRAKLQAMSE